MTWKPVRVCLPRYPLTDGIKLDAMQRMTRAAVENYADLVVRLCSGIVSHRLIDFPIWPRPCAGCTRRILPKQWQDGRYRILLDDLLEFQLGLAQRRKIWNRTLKARPIEVSAKVDARIRRLFEFRFTPVRIRRPATL
jgi:ATP-dependent DNA helicase RecG